MIDLYEELANVAAQLDAAGIPYALVGGLAYSMWVEARATEDIDLLILPDSWPGIPALLAPLGFQELTSPLEFKALRINRLTKIQDGDALVLDFLLAEEEFADAVHQSIPLPYKDRVFRVAPVDTIIELKKRRMSAKDENDIAGLRKAKEGGNPS
ncbi:MAG: hypothetical protein K1X53_08590 [Candidatus Sumerlaeaceae bacterium]|nr:hypothetical protein [Candidatus Sumerlaeaceae bacterium]